MGQKCEHGIAKPTSNHFTYLCHLDRSEAQWRDLRLCVRNRGIPSLRFTLTQVGVVANLLFPNPLGGRKPTNTPV